jgi:tRNA(fMet)-specific endonuclease VapC
MLYLLDTNILSDLLRHPKGRVAARIARHGSEKIRTSIIVASELRFGVAKGGSARLAKDVEGLLARLPVVPFETPADKFYAELRASLERSGTPIGANDMLIAAHALSLGCTLVTDNVGEFSRVKGLFVENWLR